MLNSVLLQVPEPLPHLVILLVNLAEYEIIDQIARAVVKSLYRVDTVLLSAAS